MRLMQSKKPEWIMSGGLIAFEFISTNKYRLHPNIRK